jgi:hypothetical protein
MAGQEHRSSWHGAPGVMAGTWMRGRPTQGDATGLAEARVAGIGWHGRLAHGGTGGRHRETRPTWGDAAEVQTGTVEDVGGGGIPCGDGQPPTGAGA